MMTHGPVMPEEISRPFSERERLALLQAPGVGPTATRRFGEIRMDSLATLASEEARSIAERVAPMLGSRC